MLADLGFVKVGHKGCFTSLWFEARNPGHLREHIRHLILEQMLMQGEASLDSNSISNSKQEGQILGALLPPTLDSGSAKKLRKVLDQLREVVMKYKSLEVRHSLRYLEPEEYMKQRDDIMLGSRHRGGRGNRAGVFRGDG